MHLTLVVTKYQKQKATIILCPLYKFQFLVHPIKSFKKKLRTESSLRTVLLYLAHHSDLFPDYVIRHYQYPHIFVSWS